MTRELLLTKLKTKYYNLGLGEGILGAQADYLLTLSPTEENVDSLVDGMETVLKSFQSDLDKARAQKKAEQKQEPPKQDPPNQDPPKTDDGVPEWAKAILESNKAVVEKLSAIEAVKVQKSLADKAIAKLKELGVKESFYKFHVSSKQFQNEEEIETFAQSLKEAEDAFRQDLNIESLENRTPPMFGETKTDEEVSPDVKARIDAKNKTTTT